MKRIPFSLMHAAGLVQLAISLAILLILVVAALFPSLSASVGWHGISAR